MSNNTEQNGRQLSTEQAAPPSDPRTRGLKGVPPTPDSQRICRDFVWGICSMNKHCKYRHELDYESMRSILKFCHDYQNRTGCTRPECTYLHASREEENLFLTSGVIPRVLVERYALMSVPGEPAVELQPQMMYMNDYVAPPPPPPPLAAQNSQPATVSRPALTNGSASIGPQIMPHNMTGSVRPTISPMPVSNLMPSPLPGTRQPEQPLKSQITITVKNNLHTVMPSTSAPVTASMPSLLAPPPPPPPPPPPAITTAPTQLTPPAYTVAQPPQHTMPNMYSLTPCPQIQPSPIQPPQIQQPSLQQSPLRQLTVQQPLQLSQQQGSQFSLPVLFDPSRPPPPLPSKRPASIEPEAGPSKTLKIDDSIDSLCDSCVEQNLRYALEQQENEKLQREEEYRRRILEQKTEEFETCNLLLRTLLSPNMYRMVTEFLDLNMSNEVFPSTSSPTYSGSSSTGVPKQFLFQLLEFVVNKRSTEPHSSPLEMVTRRSSSQTELMLASILELLQNGVATDSRLPLLDSIGGNGLGRLSNGTLELTQSTARYAPATPRYPTASPYVPTTSEIVPAAAPYQPEPAPPPPPQPVYVPYLAAPALAPAPAPATAPAPAPAPAPPPAPVAAPAPPPRPYYNPYPGASTSYQGTSNPYPGTSTSYPGTSTSYPGTNSAYPGTNPPYHGTNTPYPGTSNSYQGASSTSTSAPPPSQPYQYMPRPPHYYPPYQ